MPRSEEKRASGRILIVDDQVEMARLLGDQLADAGYEITLAHGGADAIAALRRTAFDLVLSDLRMEEVDGFDVLDVVRAEAPFTAVILMTAFGAIDTAIKAIQRGAFHYLTKPFTLREVLLYVERALADRRLRDENAALRAATAAERPLGIVGQSEPIRGLRALIERVAPSSAPVLIRGESGTGKELVARALHARSTRADRPFVPINCTTLPEALLESELFGHVRGAYSGASNPRRGLLLEAHGGTLFLDEIGDMAPPLQAKLLRVLEDGSIRPVGSDVATKADVRIIAATNQDLEARVRSGQFRGDLFYRLNVVPIRVPTLAERVEDLLLLIDAFFEDARQRNPSSPARFVTPPLRARLVGRSYPGNVRELKNLVERFVVMATESELTVDDYDRGVAVGEHAEEFSWHAELKPLREVENEYIAHVIGRCQGNKTKAAEILGIDVSTIHRRERERGG